MSIKYSYIRIFLAFISVQLLEVNNPIFSNFISRFLSFDEKKNDENLSAIKTMFGLHKSTGFKMGEPNQIGSCSVIITNDDSTKKATITMENGTETQTVELIKYDLTESSDLSKSDYNDIEAKYVKPFLEKCGKIHSIKYIIEKLPTILNGAVKLPEDDSFFIEENDECPAILICQTSLVSKKDPNSNTSSKNQDPDMLKLEFKNSYFSTTLVIVPSEKTVYEKEITNTLDTFKEQSKIMMSFMSQGKDSQVEYSFTEEELLDEFDEYEYNKKIPGVVFKRRCVNNGSFIIFEGSYGAKGAEISGNDSGYRKIPIINPSMYDTRAIIRALKLTLIHEAENDSINETLSQMV